MSARDTLPLATELRNARMMVNYGHGDVRDEPDPLHERAADLIEELYGALAEYHAGQITWGVGRRAERALTKARGAA